MKSVTIGTSMCMAFNPGTGEYLAERVSALEGTHYYATKIPEAAKLFGSMFNVSLAISRHQREMSPEDFSDFRPYSVTLTR